MKKLFYISSLLILVSCENLFHEEKADIQSAITDEIIISNLTGAYRALSNTFNLNSIICNYGYILQTIKGDDVNLPIMGYNYNIIIDTIDTLPLTYSFTYNGNVYRLAPSYSNYDIKLLWTAYFTSVIMANNIITRVNIGSGISDYRKQLLGEAYFLRGVCYYRMVRLFGNIPLVENIDVDYTLPKATFRELYDFIINDFILASAFLPDNSDNARIKGITPHRGTAKAFLAEVYLTMGGYPLKDTDAYIKAAETADSVINNANYFGFALLPDFADLWKNVNTDHKETILAIGNNSSIYDWGASINFSFWNGQLDAFYLGNPPSSVFFHARPFTLLSPEGKFYSSFPKSYRKDQTYNTAQLKGCFITEMTDITPVYTNLNEVPSNYDGLFLKKLPIRNYCQFILTLLILLLHSQIIMFEHKPK